MKAGHLNTQGKQADWIYNHCNKINKDFIKKSLQFYHTTISYYACRKIF